MKNFLLIFSLWTACFLCPPLECHAGQKEQTPLAVAPYYFGNENDGIIFINGSWSNSKGVYDPTSPNTSNIFCQRNIPGCWASTARADGGTLTLDTDYFDILKWDSDEIIGEDVIGTVCIKKRLVINKKLKSAEMIESPKVPGDMGYSHKFCKPETEKILACVLVDGMKAWEREMKKNCKKYFDKCE